MLSDDRAFHPGCPEYHANDQDNTMQPEYANAMESAEQVLNEFHFKRFSRALKRILKCLKTF